MTHGSTHSNALVPDVGQLIDDIITEYNEEMAAPALHDEILEKVTKRYVALLGPTRPPKPSVISKQLVMASTAVVRSENEKLAKTEKMPLVRNLAPVQVALIVHRLHYIAEVTPGGADGDDGLGILSIYQESGEFAGLYRRADLELLADLARNYRFTNDARWFSEFERAVHELAPKATETDDPDLVVMRNLIYNYRTDERIAFSPEYVYLARHAHTHMIDGQHPDQEVVDEDGTDLWNYEEWWIDTIPDEETRKYVWRVIGAALRPGHDWQKMPCLFSESGSNGKGTILEHIRAIIGGRNCASVPLKAYGSQFGKEQLIGKRLNLPDETPVGDFIKDSSDLKSIITNDPITIDRKNRKPITYKPALFTILALNGALNFRDKTASMDRRVAIVPMTQRFTGEAKNKAIKLDYLQRREVCEYMAYKVLVQMPKYWDLEEPESVTRALKQHKIETNAVLGFYEEYKDEFKRPFVPFAQAYAMFVASRKSQNPQSRIGLGINEFTKDLKGLLDPSEWVVPTLINEKDRTESDRKLTVRHWLSSKEPVLEEYGYVPEVSKWQWYGGSDGNLGDSAPRQTRGFVRRDVYESWVAAGSKPGKHAVDLIVDQIRLEENAANAKFCDAAFEAWKGDSPEPTVYEG